MMSETTTGDETTACFCKSSKNRVRNNNLNIYCVFVLNIEYHQIKRVECGGNDHN